MTPTVADGVELADLWNALTRARSDAGDALRTWTQASRGAKRSAYAAYREALEREELAQRMLVGRLAHR